MTPQIFVSHASHDKNAVEKLCNELAAHDVEVWASFKDIPPGAEWDKSIQEALELATHVLVLVSKASVESSYVRAEVEYALDNKKTVIPVLIEEVKLPVRWHTLQHITLLHQSDEPIKKLALFLPNKTNVTLQLLEEALSSQTIDKLRDFIVQNFDWLLSMPIHSFKTGKTFVSAPAVLLPKEGATLIVEISSDTITKHYSNKMRISPGYEEDDGYGYQIIHSGYFCILGSQQTAPFDKNGAISMQIQEALDKIIASDLFKSLTPQLPAHNSYIQITALAGRRSHYSKEINQNRLMFETKHHLTCNFNIVSYDRLVEHITNSQKGILWKGKKLS